MTFLEEFVLIMSLEDGKMGNVAMEVSKELWADSGGPVQLVPYLVANPENLIFHGLMKPFKCM